jgi:hypothetical protein
MTLDTALIGMGGAVGSFAYQMVGVTWTVSAIYYAMILPAGSYGAILAFAHQQTRRRDLGCSTAISETGQKHFLCSE